MEVLGIDIGGSSIKGAIVNVNNAKLLTNKIKIETPNPATPSNIVEVITQLIDIFNWKGIIGFGFPAAVKDGIIKTASNIDKSWIGLDFNHLLSKATHQHCFVLNDVDAAGIAEITFGKAKKYFGSVIMIAVGTGIGTSLFTNKVLFPNTELGFIKVKDIEGELYASNSVKENLNLSLETWAHRFNEYLQRLESLFWPDVFIMGGGICKQFDEFKHLFTINTTIKQAKFKNNAGIIGAAFYAYKIVNQSKSLTDFKH